ncbi:MAG: GHKL domain-containing protein [Clostridia bacterium]|nr:GHKL domain-containing protein [Clostridia bacterium]
MAAFLQQLLFSIPEAILVILLGLSILGLKPTLKQVLIIGFIQGVLGAYVSLLPWPFGIHTVIYLFSSSFLIFLVMGIQYKFSLLSILLGLSIGIGIEVTSLPILITLTGFSISEILADFWLKLAFYLPKVITMVLVMFLIRHFNVNLAGYYNLTIRLEPEKIRGYLRHKNKYFLLVFIFLAQNFVIALFFFSKYLHDSIISKTVANSFLSMGLILLVLIVVGIITTRRVIMSIQKELERNIQLEAIRDMNNFSSSLRAQCDGFSNDLNVVSGLLEIQAFQEAKEYINTSMDEIATTLELVKTENPGLTALLLTKTGVAEANRINLQIFVLDSFKDLPMESKDINTILGNLIDNALEAVSELQEQRRVERVEVVLFQDLEDYVFQVRNFGSTSKPELTERIFEPMFSTKGEGRGMGLYHVKQLVQKYNGQIGLTCDIGYTCFKITLPKKTTLEVEGDGHWQKYRRGISPLSL